MKKLITICLLALGFFSASQTAKGATYTVGAGGNYTSLYAAFDDINNGNITGAIELQITSNLVETNMCQLDFSGFGGSYTSVKIYPTAANLSITGSFWPGHLIYFNGADNVTIDGRVNATGSTPSLRIAYTGSSSAGNSVIYFGNNSQYNKIQYCNITTNAYDINLITFEGAQNAIGNSNNRISNNNIYGMFDLYSLTHTGIESGQGNDATSNNKEDSIINNNIYNLRSYGIRMRTGTSGWYIAGNSFYDTYGEITNDSRTYYGIYVDYSNMGANINATIQNNYFGGSAPICGGNPFYFENGAKRYYAIQANNANLIDGNIIKNIKIKNTSLTNVFNGIITGGSVIVNNNTLGSLTENASIEVEATTGFGHSMDMIAINDPGAQQQVWYNTISGIKLHGVATVLGTIRSFRGILAVGGDNISIKHNIIGGNLLAKSIDIGNDDTDEQVNMQGIQVIAWGASVNIDSNSISSFHSESTHASSSIVGIELGNSSSTLTTNIKGNQLSNFNGTTKIQGIFCNNSGGALRTITDNKLFNFNINIPGSSATNIFGINSTINSISPVVIKNNFVHSFQVANSNSTIVGIRGENANNGSLVVNNIVTLTTSNGNLFGLVMPNNVNTKVMHNTIYLGATSNRNSLTACLDLDDNIPSVISNNIFFNNIANLSGVTKNHFAIYNRSNSNIPSSNYNVYRVPNTSAGGAVAYWNNTASTYNNLNQWKFITNQDTNSVNIDPLFVNPGGSQAADYYPTASVIGANYLGITNDYYNNNRGSIFWMGALQSQAPLPLKWEYFHATDYKNSVELVWATTYEENVSHFELEYSTNSTEWKSLAKVMANNESSNQYSYSDRIPFSGNRYYRIKQVDADNKFSYSKVEKVTRASNSEVTFYPNPCTMNLNIISSDDASYEVEVYSLDGKVVLNSSINSGSEKLDVSNLKSGIYFIKLFNKDRTITSKFTKQ